MRSKKELLFASVAALAVVGATPVYGQVITDMVEGIDEITVTATKRNESVNVVPMSITAISGKDLQLAGVTDITSLVKLVPGLVAIDSSYGTPNYYIRGVGFYEQSLLAKSTVGIYVDEAPIPYPVMSVGAAFDLERVEVLKGPQGTLFGSNATAGAINFIAAKPTEEFNAQVYGNLGRFNAVAFGGHVSGALSPTVSGRLSFKRETGGDWQRSTTRPNDTLGSRRFTQMRGQLLWKPTPSLRTHLTLSGFVDQSDTQSAQLVAPFANSPTTVLPPALLNFPTATSNARDADWDYITPLARDNNMFQAVGRIDYDLNEDIVLTSITSYSRYRQHQGVDSDGTSLLINDVESQGEIDAFNQELRLSGEVGGLRWLVGGNYEDSSSFDSTTSFPLDTTSARAFVPLGLPIIDQTTFQADIDFESWAVFGNLDYDLGDLITLHAGVRYTEADNRFEGCLTQGGNLALGSGLATIFGLTPPQPGDCVTVGQNNGAPAFVSVTDILDEDNVSWRLGVDIKPVEGKMVYANVSRGYKSGTFTNLSGTSPSQYMPAVQEELTAYEVGLKASLLDQRAQVNLALFYYDYTDKQLRGRISTPIFGFLEALINIPESDVKGVDFQASLKPAQGLTISGGGVYVETEITESYMNFTGLGELIDFNGAEFPYTPKWQLNGKIDYQWEMAENISGFAGANLTYRSSTNGDFKPDPRVDIDDYLTLDLHAGFEDSNGRWRLAVYGRNVTDKYYWITATRRTDAIVRFAGAPATYGVEMTFNFGG